MIKHTLLTFALLITSLIMVSAAEEAPEPDKRRAPTFTPENEDEQKQTAEELAQERFATNMQEAFVLLNTTCRYPQGDEKFVVPSPWKGKPVKLPLPTGETTSFSDLHLKDSQTASDALNRFFQKPQTRPLWVIECRIAQMIAFADTVRNELTNDVFDQVFKPDVNLGIFMAMFSTHVYKVPVSSYSQMGTLGYFANLPMYQLFTGGKGLHNGINVVLCGLNQNGQKIYMGMGDFFKTGPKTYEEIRGYLLRHLLHEPVEGMPAKNYESDDSTLDRVLLPIYMDRFMDGITAEQINQEEVIYQKEKQIYDFLKSSGEQVPHKFPLILTRHFMQMKLRETHAKNPSALLAMFDEHQKTDQAANAIIVVNRNAIQAARQQYQRPNS